MKLYVIYRTPKGNLTFKLQEEVAYTIYARSKANAEEIYNIIQLGDLVKNKPLADKFTIRPVDKQGRQLRNGGSL